jgi:hypothetical protein
MSGFSWQGSNCLDWERLQSRSGDLVSICHSPLRSQPCLISLEIILF